LSNESTAEEREKVENWIRSKPEHEKAYLLMRGIWQTKETDAPATDIRSVWHEILKRTGIRTTRPPRIVRGYFSSGSPAVIALRWAAVALLVLTPLWMVWRLGGPLPSWISEKSVTVANGGQETIRLPDGSRVTLDAGSTMTCPRRFSGRDRRVTFLGEAYFEITPIDETASMTINREVLDAGRINQSRFPAYHSLNLRADSRFYFTRSNLIVFLSVWNAYNRKNVYCIHWNEIDRKIETSYQWSMLPILGLEYVF
jgi:hypothetical protein